MNPKHKRIALAAGVGSLAALFVACQSVTKGRPPLEIAAKVDIPRFMGDWYVIANIPTFIEKGAHGAKETYRLDTDGTIATTFTFRADSFDGPQKEYSSRGFVRSPSGAIWGQQFVWPIKADYRIAYVADDYSQTIVGREQRDYVWIMARTPTISEADLQRHIAFAVRQGYDASKIERVPQR